VFSCENPGLKKQKNIPSSTNSTNYNVSNPLFSNMNGIMTYTTMSPNKSTISELESSYLNQSSHLRNLVESQSKSKEFAMNIYNNAGGMFKYYASSEEESGGGDNGNVSKAALNGSSISTRLCWRKVVNVARIAYSDRRVN
jgi:hypothetical protein